MASWFYNKVLKHTTTPAAIKQLTLSPSNSQNNNILHDQESSSVYVPRYIGKFVKNNRQKLAKYYSLTSIQEIVPELGQSGTAYMAVPVRKTPVQERTLSRKATLVYDTSRQKKIKKAVVFDMDETIGSFTELFYIWNEIRPADYIFSRDKYLFIELADIYPELLRPGIITILKYIREQINGGNCYKLHVYTNNQCTYPEWIQLLIYYFDELVHKNHESSMFEKPICAFKINNTIIEKNRTTNAKSHADLIRCSILPETTEICFVDDTKFEKMVNERVYYIRPPPYKNPLSYETMETRFVEKYARPFPTTVRKQWFLKNKDNLKTEKEISKKILYYIREFFMMKYVPKETKKIGVKLGKFTRKNTAIRL